MASPRDRVIEVREFRGLNLYASEANSNIEETHVAENVLIAVDGAVSKRPTWQPAFTRVVDLDKLSEIGTAKHWFVTHVVLGVIPSVTVDLTSPRAYTTLVAVGESGTWFGIVGNETFSEDQPSQVLEVVSQYVNTDMALSSADSTGASVTAACGNLYVTVEEQTWRVQWYDADDFDAIEVHLLPSPTASREWYRALPVGNDGEERPERPWYLLQQSWSTNLANPYADCQRLSTEDAWWTADPADPTDDVDVIGRFPPAHVTAAFDLGAQELVYASYGPILRWSHPTRWLDSGYWGYCPEWTASQTPPITRAEAGDAGDDWPFGSPSHRREADDVLRFFGPEDWHSNAFTAISQADGGDITAFAFWYDAVLVWKDRGMWALRGTLPAKVYTTPVSDEVGCPNSNAWCATAEGGALFFYSHPHGVYMWDTSTLKLVSQSLGVVGNQVDAVTGNAIDTDRVTLNYWNQLLVLTLPFRGDASGPAKQYVMDTRTGVWTEWIGGIDQTFVVPYTGRRGPQPPRLMGVSGDGTAICFLTVPGTTYHDTFDNLGLAIDDPGNRAQPVKAKLRAGPFRDDDAPDTRCAWRRMRVETINRGDAPIRTTVTRTFDDSSPRAAESKMSEELEYKNGVQQFRSTSIGKRGRTMHVEFEWEDTDLLMTAVLALYWSGKRS